jgi:hypothetical protein
VYKPCEYYASPSPERVLPEWATYGCGALAVVALVVVFAGGAYMAGGGFLDLMDLTLGMTMGELRGMYASDVTPALKSSLETEMTTMRKLLREQKIGVPAIQPVLETIRKTSGDKKLSRAEVERIIAAVKKANVQFRTEIPVRSPGRPAAGDSPAR